MRRLPALGAVVLLALGVLIGLPAPAHACSCASSSAPELLSKSDAAFVGRLAERRGSDGDLVRFALDVSRVYKGTVSAKTVVYSEGRGGGDCGVTFESGEERMVLARLESGRLVTSLCRGTSMVKESEVAASGFDAYSPVAAEHSPPPVGSAAEDDPAGSEKPFRWLLGVGVVGVVLLGGAYWAARVRGR
ncbi:hypothetical protein [Luteipulveratus mongoliensis]|uniref:Tissue inhibitor of metalloproteinase n=1 Tax=Luteipulveratus mongoliensis TaxID=571913 RepID=A0A0K1JEI5_9MICO|nr:hypothetical protein [Luteipulveratus mongoliensis]AKU15114.1 hypothetical protein VV02_03295 [Luteipulveratus mongoliensis]